MNRRQFLTRATGVALTPATAMAATNYSTIKSPEPVYKTTEYLTDELARYRVKARCRVFIATGKLGRAADLQSWEVEANDEFMMPTDLLHTDVYPVCKLFRSMASPGDIVGVVYRHDKAGVSLVKWLE